MLSMSRNLGITHGKKLSKAASLAASRLLVGLPQNVAGAPAKKLLGQPHCRYLK